MTSTDETAMALVHAVVDRGTLLPETERSTGTCPVLWDQPTLNKLFDFANASAARLNAVDAACERVLNYHMLERDDVPIEDRHPAIVTAWWLRQRIVPINSDGWTATPDGFSRR